MSYSCTIVCIHVARYSSGGAASHVSAQGGAMLASCNKDELGDWMFSPLPEKRTIKLGF